MSAPVLIVDGHSIIFGWSDLRKAHSRSPAIGRHILVKLLAEYQDFTGTHVVAVFDGKGERSAECEEPAPIQVFYSGSGQTADDVVERLVARYARERDITVATSDMVEQQTVSSFGALCISAEGLKGLLCGARVDLERALKVTHHASR